MANRRSLVGKICIVTGATRGIGKGIALQLAEAGALVYITGRTLRANSNSKGSLEDTANEVENRGGRCIPIQCDHSKDDEVEKLFDRVKTEQNGQLDILVNNAYSAVKAVGKELNVPFWEQPLTMWDDCNHVGLRNHYLCAVHASRIMVPRRQGLIINISSIGGLRYVFTGPYGIGKEACDRMAADCAVELKTFNIAFISLWPGVVRTENLFDMIKVDKIPLSLDYDNNSESAEFAGRAIVHLASDPNVMKKTGRIMMTGDLAAEYGFKDIDGRNPPNFRSVSGLLSVKRHWFASFVPNWIKIPGWILAIVGSKF